MVLAHPTGNAFFRHLALSAREAGRLEEVLTCIAWRPAWALARMLPGGLRAELGRRSLPSELDGLAVQHPWREAARLAAGRLGQTWLARHETGILSVDAVYRDFDRWVAARLARTKGVSVAYAYEDSAEGTLAEAGRLGWTRAYDLPIAYWETSRRLLGEEAERLPAWERTLGGTRDSPEKLARKTRELELADVVVCPSRFVADSLPEWARRSKRVVVAPFGSPGGVARGETPARSSLRVLFAGSMSQRKGLGDLFAAMRLLGRGDVELVVMGSPVAPMEFYRREFPGLTHEPPRPHAEVLKLMETCDVFCLPSIVEGRALVIQEAMSRGLPAIITPNTGAADVVEDGRNGFVVPIRSPEAIAGKIAWCADNRRRLPEMGRLAREAAAKVTWEDYGATILAALAP
jgi:glycosyltransferase involved in cell wall biosynthesis